MQFEVIKALGNSLKNKEVFNLYEGGMKYHAVSVNKTFCIAYLVMLRDFRTKSKNIYAHVSESHEADYS